METDLAIFIDNRPYDTRRMHENKNAPPLLTYVKSDWYHQRWEIMEGASPMICGWCGQSTPVYPIQLEQFAGTICHDCGRTVDDFYRGWVYRAEYYDGCKVILFRDGGVSSLGVDSRSGLGGTHAPHSAFSEPDELPVYEFLAPWLSLMGRRWSRKKLLLFFRKAVRENRLGWLDHPIFKAINALPETAVTLGGAKG